MYSLKPGTKSDPSRRWSLPDRIFFGHGACHILAGAYLRAQVFPGFYAERIIPVDGRPGNHIYVTDGVVAFDHHGYSLRERLLRYHERCWRSRHAFWTYDLERVQFDLLDTKALNDRKMLGPGQYLFDALDRAVLFLARIDHPQAYGKALSLAEER